MCEAVAEWVGIFLAVQWSGGGWVISEVLLIGPEKKKREISVHSMIVWVIKKKSITVRAMKQGILQHYTMMCAASVGYRSWYNASRYGSIW